MQPGMKLLKYSACAVGIVLSMLVEPLDGTWKPPVIKIAN